MNTLLVSPELFAAEGGIARILRCYLKALCELAGPGDSVDALVLNDAAAADPRLARYANGRLRAFIACDRSRGRFALNLLDLATRTDRALCGHLHLLPLLWVARQVNPALRYSLIAHGIEVWRPYSALERRALAAAHRIFCVSDYTRRQVLRFLPGLDPSRLLIVPNSVDPALPASPASLDRKGGARPRLLAVSRLSAADAYKGVDTLIEALPAVRRHLPDASLRIVGTGDDLPRLRRLVTMRGLDGCVAFAGKVDDAALQAEYAACDLFALPSRREGFGLVYLEAMMHGKPCLAARAGGAPEVVDDRVGALAEYGNISDIAAAVIDLVRHPRPPEAMRRHVAGFGFNVFKRQLAAILV